MQVNAHRLFNWKALGALVALAVLLIGALWFTGALNPSAATGEADSAAPAGHEEAKAKTPPAPDKTTVKTEAEAGAKTANMPGKAEVPAEIKKPALVFAATPISNNPEAVTKNFGEIASGEALEAMRVEADEAKNEGRTATGEAVVVASTLIEETDSTAKVAVCVDSSRIEIKNSEGEVVVPATKEGTKRALSHVELKKQDGKWLVVSRTFPNDPNC